ncbi:MAG: hypothetical protein AB7N76_18605 [Planctomycetota bacterium]
MTVARVRRLAWGFPALLLLAALPLSAAPDPKDLTKQLNAAISAQDASKVQAALAGLIEAGGKASLDPVLKGVQQCYGGGSQAIYWQLVSGASGFRDKEALEMLGDFIMKSGRKKAPFARDLLFGLENNSSPHTVACLGMILADKKVYDLQLMAADQLAQIHTVPSVDALIAALKAEGDKGDPELRRRLMSSLASVTKEELGEVASNWIDWWKVQREKGLPGARGGAAPGGDGDGGNDGGVEMGGGGGGGNATTTMNRDRKKQFESVQKQPNRIIVLSARRPEKAPKSPGEDFNYDHMEQVLDQMKIPHVVVLKADFEANPDKYLAEAWTVLVNCNNIQSQCVCPTCRKLLNERAAKGQDIGAKTNRLYHCPPECSTHDSVSYRMKKEAVDKLKKWVEDGGYLFTEDWGLIEIIDVAWPDRVSSDTKSDANGGQAKTAQSTAMDVTIMPGKGMTSQPILRGVFTKPRPPATKDDDKAGGDGGTKVRDLPIDPTAPPSVKWKIDDQSPLIKVTGKDVDVLMRSEELGKAANGMDTVAASFRAGNGQPGKEAAKKAKRGPVTGSGGDNLTGKSRGRGAWGESLRGGRVLHVLSHFGHQQGSSEDTNVLQNLILNFIMESNHQHGG